MATFDDNQACQAENDAVDPFKNNFIDTPWDDRSKNSKIGIISLLVGIIAVIVICVCNSAMMHYATGPASFKNNCHVMNSKDMDNYNFVAKVYSISPNQAVCLGAMVSANAVLVDELCARIGPLSLLIGTPKNPRCKKRYPIDNNDIIEIEHGGVLSSKKLAILKSRSNLAECGRPIRIGSNVEWSIPAFLIGRPLTAGGRALKKHPVFAIGRGNCTLEPAMSKSLDSTMIICVKDSGHCPVHGGELLVQRGQLIGLASACVHRSIRAESYFADLTIDHIANQIMLIAKD